MKLRCLTAGLSEQRFALRVCRPSLEIAPILQGAGDTKWERPIVAIAQTLQYYDSM